MPWGDTHGTRDIEELLGDIELKWVETAHFRIGSSLPEHKLGREDKAAVQAELKRLRKRLPRIKATARKLDPWLRLHLYAMRLEDLYAEFCELVGVTDADFPADEVAADRAAVFRGLGPYLGQPDKFCVLLLEQESSLGRYARKYAGLTAEGPIRHNFGVRGSLLFGTAHGFFEGRYQEHAQALHAHVVWCVVQDLVRGYKSYRHQMPRWWNEGLAHWFARRVHPEFTQFSQLEGRQASDLVDDWDWPPKVRARVSQDYYPSAKDMLAMPLSGGLTFADNMMMWSRIDFLLTEQPEGVRVFMDDLNDVIPTQPGLAPTYEQVLERARSSLKKAWGYDAAGLDEAWSRWVKKNYPKS